MEITSVSGKKVRLRKIIDVNSRNINSFPESIKKDLMKYYRDIVYYVMGEDGNGKVMVFISLKEYNRLKKT